MPGALVSLRRLRSEESNKRQRRFGGEAEMMEKLAVCSRALLSLPFLHQLLASGALFTSIIKNVLKM